MKTKEGKLKLLEFENLSKVPNLTNFVTSRRGGISKAPYDSLNLGLHTADNTELVNENRKLLAQATGIDSDKFLFVSQLHSGDVKVIDKEAMQKGVMSASPFTDATITNLPGICLMVMVADCVPVLLFDPVKRVSAVIHAGWRGTVKHITVNTISKMKDHFGCNPADIVAGIGPSIGPCCYEVGKEVSLVVEQSFETTEGYLVYHTHNIKPHFDLWYANHKQLTSNGVRTENIETSMLCTKCRHDIFFSSRASAGITGRFAAGMYISG